MILRSTLCRTLLLVCALAAIVPGRARAALSPAAVDPVLTYSGYLLDATGRPVAGPTTITFRLYSTDRGGVSAWEEPVTVVPDTEGWFVAVLGAAVPMSADLFSGPLWLALHVAGDSAEMSPRSRLTAAPSAISVEWDRVANKPTSFPAVWAELTGKPESFPSSWSEISGKPTSFPVDPAIVQLRVVGACPAGQYVRAVAQDGSVTCGTDASGTGTVTAVTVVAPLASTGGTAPQLSLPAASGTQSGYLRSSDWTLFAAKLGSVARDLTLVGDGSPGNPLGLAPGAAQAPITGGPCPLGSYMTDIGPGGGIECTPELGGGSVTAVTALAPLAVANGSTTPTLSIAQASASSSGFLSASDWAAFNSKLAPTSGASGDLSGTFAGPTVAKIQGHAVSTTAPANGQVLKWNGAAWAPGADTSSGGTVTMVTAAPPLAVANNSTTPTVSIGQATATTSGYLSSADWASFNSRLAASTVAGGDLQGTMANPTVTRIRGQVLPSVVGAGQMLRFDGYEWVATTPMLVCQTRETIVSVAPGSGTATAQCQSGETPAGGSGHATPMGPSLQVSSFPNGTGWTAMAWNGTGGTVSLVAYARCCRIHFQ